MRNVLTWPARPRQRGPVAGGCSAAAVAASFVILLACRAARPRAWR